jgi:hypothetical protein
MDPKVEMGHGHRRAAAKLFEARGNEAVAQGAKAAGGQPARWRALLAHVWTASTRR